MNHKLIYALVLFGLFMQLNHLSDTKKDETVKADIIVETPAYKLVGARYEI